MSSLMLKGQAWKEGMGLCYSALLDLSLRGYMTGCLCQLLIPYGCILQAALEYYKLVFPHCLAEDQSGGWAQVEVGSLCLRTMTPNLKRA